MTVMPSYGPHLTRIISYGHFKRRLGIIFLLIIDKRFFDCIQLILGVELKASLISSEYTMQPVKSFLSTYPYSTLRVRLESEFSHNSLINRR